MRLETERLRLRRLTVDDVDELVALDADPEVMRYLTGGRPTPVEVVRDEQLPRLLDQYQRHPGLGRWAAEDRVTGEFLGWLALDPTPDGSTFDGSTLIDPVPSDPVPSGAVQGGTVPSGGPVRDRGEDGVAAELGYRLRRVAWGRGLATEGSRALLRYAFDTVGVRRVWAQTMAVNTRSRAVLERAGLRYVRTFHLHFDDPIPGTEHGEVEYEARNPACRRSAS
ncbi:GNAT family N-acetyltransferase [Micromonospora yangpuensis]|uniref:Protein N-acetyltransferase, RimJ/RimL family n=1 Tax=Micromonospora yangpuensis TaxID=683228 RepID=A0A1C6VED8_9ACTN|nr:GNAT family N-acetyltransferase [Micromonospora yangpuensis]GGM30496.1 GNAT family acetyltransferase [Micromonospora yangpuensis]SCL64706.1 Protein N-acetyltransferase, RimJ/RimL family [Micromonospora yangpuensis]